MRECRLVGLEGLVYWFETPPASKVTLIDTTKAASMASCNGRNEMVHPALGLKCLECSERSEELWKISRWSRVPKRLAVVSRGGVLCLECGLILQEAGAVNG